MQFGNSGGICSYCGAPAGIAQSASYALPPGTILHGSYLLGMVLGAGGFGVTYIAMHIPSGRRVAVKEFLPSDFASRAIGSTYVDESTHSDDFQLAKKSFLREARTIYQLRGYPGVVHVEKLFEENNTAYYVMEYLDGCDLKRLLRDRNGPLSAAEAARLLSPVFDTLTFIHAQGIVHRDVSPDNIFICRDGMVKLIDFGAAYAAVREQSQSMQLFVKHGYAPVEQYMSSGKLGPWSDEYAFAATIYFALTGVVPPNAPERNYQDGLIPPSRCGVEITPAAEAALLRAMSVGAQRRFPNVQEFRTAFFGQEKSALPALGGAQSLKTPFGVRLRGFIAKFTALFEPKRRQTLGASARADSEIRPLALQCISGVYAGNVFRLSAQSVRMGRDPAMCGIVFPPGTPGVSRVHCEVLALPQEHAVSVTDLGSRYGTHISDGGTLLPKQACTVKKGTGFALGNEWFTVAETEE